MQSESLQSIIENLKQELKDKTRQLEDANARASNLQKQLAENVNETSSNEVKFAEVWKENKILRRVIAKETEEVRLVYDKCLAVIQKYQELEAQYKEVLSFLLNAEPHTASQNLLVKLQKENEEHKAALEAMTTRFTNKKSKYSTLKGEYKQVKEELDKLKSSDPKLNDKAKLLEEIAKLKNDVKTKDSEIDSLNKTVSDLKIKLEIGKYEVNDEAPQALDDFINRSRTEEPEAEELEAKYNAAKKERALLIQDLESDKTQSLHSTDEGNEDSEIYTSNEVEMETDNNDERVNDRIQVVSRVVHLAEEEGNAETDTGRETEAETETETETERENENNDEGENDVEADKVAQELASLLDRPPAENLEEANSRIKLLEDKIKELCEQFQESSLNISNCETQDFQAALKRISKLQKKLNDRSNPPENMKQFEDEISRLRTELQESSNHAKELQDLLDSFSKTTNSGVVEVVKENQNMKKMIERKDKEIEDATKKGADILSKYNEQQNTIKTLINELKSAKSKSNELTRNNAELSARVEQLEQDLDQADADAESFKDDLSKLDEITAKSYLIQTELDTTKIKLDKAMQLLKTKGGPRAIYALEVYDNIINYQQEIAAQKELLKGIEKVLQLQPDSLLNLVDKENQPKPDPIHENRKEDHHKEEEEEEERIQRKVDKLKDLLAGHSKNPVESNNLLLLESNNDFFKEHENLKQEAEKLRTIISQIEEELHLQPGHLLNRDIDNELDVQNDQDDKKKLPSGWLNKIVAENNGGSGLFVKSRGINLEKNEEEEEEEDSEKAKEIQRLSTETTNNQTKILELEAICESLRRQVMTLNNKLSIMDTDRLAALQTNTILSDKCKDYQRKISRLNNKLRNGNRNNLNSSLSISVNEVKNE